MPVAIVTAVFLSRLFASTRHLVWQLVLIVMLISPVLSVIIPGSVQISILDEALERESGGRSVLVTPFLQ